MSRMQYHNCESRRGSRGSRGWTPSGSRVFQKVVQKWFQRTLVSSTHIALTESVVLGAFREIHAVFVSTSLKKFHVAKADLASPWSPWGELGSTVTERGQVPSLADEMG